MEYNEMIERLRNTPAEIPDTNTIINGMRHALRRRRMMQTGIVAAACVFLLAFPLLTPSPTPQQGITLTERVSLRSDNTPTKEPASITGYRQTKHNRQIYTFL